MTLRLNFKINSFYVYFLGINGLVEETHAHMYKVKPICPHPAYYIETIKEDLNDAIGEDERPYMLEVRTSTGKFMIQSRWKK